MNIAGKKDCPTSEKVTRKNSATGLQSAHRGAQVTGLESEQTLKSLPPRAGEGGCVVKATVFQPCEPLTED